MQAPRMPGPPRTGPTFSKKFREKPKQAEATTSDVPDLFQFTPSAGAPTPGTGLSGQRIDELLARDSEMLQRLGILPGNYLTGNMTPEQLQRIRQYQLEQRRATPMMAVKSLQRLGVGGRGPSQNAFRSRGSSFGTGSRTLSFATNRRAQ